MFQSMNEPRPNFHRVTLMCIPPLFALLYAVQFVSILPICTVFSSGDSAHQTWALHVRAPARPPFWLPCATDPAVNYAPRHTFPALATCPVKATPAAIE